MARAVLERQLGASRKSRVSFSLATHSDDAQIRRLLRDNAMPGRISISLEREPHYFADAGLSGELKQTIVARDNGRIVCMGNCAIRRRFVNGEPRSVGYLGGLRLDATQAGRFDIVRRGYEFFHELQADAPADFYFTTIASDNIRARKFLERGLPGMPRYEFVGEFATLLLPTGRPNTRPGTKLNPVQFTDQFVVNLNEHNRRYQFAPCWTASELAGLSQLGLTYTDFYSLTETSDIVAAAIWDQRKFKQTVIRGCHPSLAMLRPVHNFFADILGRSKLPAAGATLASGFVSHLTAGAHCPEGLCRLISGLLGRTAERGLEFLTLGFAANDPRLEQIGKHFRFRQYRSRLYVVGWPGIGRAAADLNNQIIAPEVSLL